MALVKEYMDRAGIKTRSDQFGNLFGRLEGKDSKAPVVMSGSHVDTVVHGGRFDGTVGTLSAIEVLQSIKENEIAHIYPLEVAVFVSEEPARFGGGTLGSKAFIGDYTRADLDRLRDKDGITLAQAIKGAGFDPDELYTVKADPKNIKCFVELHIEQSIILETQKVPIGVVDQIAAPTNMRLIIKGQAGHAGATPMDLRRDAFVAAAEIALEIERIANTIGRETVGTVGEVVVSPNTINVIPGEVMLGIDIRDITAERKDRAIAQLEEAIKEISLRRRVETKTELIARQEPVKTAPNIVDLIRRTCQQLGIPYMNITSGAYHDALNMARLTDIGMIFVPSVNGISHAPEEFTHFEDIFRGAQVLAGVLIELAR
jgi:hydantoinase/carbamoylase family amidase